MQSIPSKRYQKLQPEDHVTLVSPAQQKYCIRAMKQDWGRAPHHFYRGYPPKVKHRSIPDTSRSNGSRNTFRFALIISMEAS